MGVTKLDTSFKDEDDTELQDLDFIQIRIVDNGFILKESWSEDEYEFVFDSANKIGLMQKVSDILEGEKLLVSRMDK